ncbi:MULTISPECIES: hypothetical protein [unclassified Imperialibacter]|uniref:hypothetical protein n=1 Tax=unclassified Imperialibacter TaxID=2629706 RepID=UPI0012510144|nr:MULTISPECIES: hypothetical protein [unclassified Imperialibacter]CAD5276545.1 hypothetical protein IMPERIA89_410040 [Imperialibacter sp. 89]CAD5294727.1 hypothetical protein IMPERIA75_680010 [Imperialibacter sp. 75]VVT26879.1 hypothetical protein IMPR6_400040 [Imperialibacter sp. EC-SDR9]
MKLPRPPRKQTRLSSYLLKITLITSLSAVALYFLSIGTLREMAVKLAGTIIVQVVEEESDGFYGVSFDKIEIDLFRRQINFSNFRLSVDSVSQNRFHSGEDSRENMYITHIPLLTLRIKSLYDLYLNRNLQVAAIDILQPDIKWYKNPKEEKFVTLSLEAGDFYQLITDYLNHFEITDFKITEGYFTYIKNLNDVQQTYLVGPVNASVDNFEIGQSVKSEDRFLNTEKLLLQISKQSVKLADSIHVVEFDDLSLSTETSDIVFTNLKLKPRVEKLPVPDSVNSYEVFIPKFRLTNVDFIQAYNDNILKIGDIFFEQPAININEVTRVTRKRGENQESTSIVELLTSLFDVIEVQNFDLDRALLDLKFYGGKNQDRFTVQNASVGLRKFRIDTSTVIFSRDNKIFEHIDFTVDEYAYFLPDSIHRLFIKKFRFSTLDSIIRGDSLVIAPIQGLSQRWFAEKADMQKRFYVPAFELSQVELWNGWENKELVVGKLEVSSSEFFLKRLNDPKKKIGFREIANFYPYISHIFSSLSVAKLQVDKSEVYFYDREKQRFSSPEIEVLASSFRVDSLTQLDSTKFFHADDLVVKVGQSRLLFPDDSHILEIGDFSFNPIKGNYIVENVVVTPYTPSGWSAEGKIRQMKMTGFYLKEFLIEGEWLADSVMLINPDIRINSYKRRKGLKKASLGKVEVKKLDIYRGNLFVNLRDTSSLQLSDYSIEMTGVGYQIGRTNNWHINDASTSIAGLKIALPGKVNMDVKEIKASLSDSTFSTLNFNYTLPPGKGLARLVTPGIDISGIDILAVIKGDHIKWNRATFGGASIEWTVAAGSSEGKGIEAAINKVKTRILGGYDYVKGNEIHFPLRLLTTRQDTISKRISNINFDLGDIYFDKQSTVASSPIGFARDISMETNQQDFSWLDGFDTFTLSRLLLSTADRKISLLDFRLATDREGKFIAMAFAPQLDISGLDLKELLLTGNFSADSIQARLDFLAIDDRNNTAPKGGKIKPANGNAALGNLEVRYINIDGDKLSYQNAAKNRSWEIPSFEIQLRGFLMNENQKMKEDRLLFSEAYKVSLDNIAFRLPDSLYRVQIDRLSINSQAPQVVIEGPTVLPFYGMYEHAHVVGHQTPWVQAKGRQIALYDPNLFGLLQGDEIVARKVELSNFYVRMFKDKRMPFPADQVRSLPQLQLLEMKMPLQIDSLLLTNSALLYLEFAEDGTEPGELMISELSARGTNITNKPEAIARNSYANLHAQALMMDAGLLKADFVFDLTSKAGTHYVTGTVGPTDLQKANSFLVPITFVQVRDGKLNEAYFNFEADTSVAVGNMDFLYNDLKINVLNRKEEKQGTGKAFESFFANAFIVSSNNPTLFSTRQGGIFFERDTSRSIINYWSKAFLSGVISSIGARSNKDKIKQWQEEVYEKNATQQSGTNEEK